jgi:hypothetical protein
MDGIFEFLVNIGLLRNPSNRLVQQTVEVGYAEGREKIAIV